MTPEPVRVITDSREQCPYTFNPERVISTRRGLPAGDYSLEGMETRVAVERKSLDDFVSTVIRARARFAKELRKLADYESACVVVEANLRDVLDARYTGGAHPNAVFVSALSITVDYGVPVFFCSDRQVACRFVEDYLIRVHRKLREQP